MKIFTIRNKAGRYYHSDTSISLYGTWGSEDDASIYHSMVEAICAGICAFNGEDDAEEKFEVVEYEARVV